VHIISKKSSWLLLQSTHHISPEKHTYPSSPPYSEASNGVAVVTPASAATADTAKSTAVTVSSAKDRQKTKNVAGPPVYYPPGVELFTKKEESMAMQVSTSTKKEIKTHLGLTFKVHTFIYLHFTVVYSQRSLRVITYGAVTFKTNYYLEHLSVKERIILKKLRREFLHKIKVTAVGLKELICKVALSLYSSTYVICLAVFLTLLSKPNTLHSQT
jgi:hypothetical protein